MADGRQGRPRGNGSGRPSSRSGSRGPGSGGARRGGPSGGGRRSGPEGRRKPAGDKGRPSSQDRKRLAVHAGGQLPRWVRDEITRSTPKDRREAALRELERGVEAFAAERYEQAARALRKAKAASSRSATIRELLGLSAYHVENWEEALRELRAFRRMSGETDQMPIEMDALRALGRPGDVDKTYALFHELGGGRDTDNEVRVVYASHLLDQGRVADAWAVIKPGRLISDPPESVVRRWAVAARVANAAGDLEATEKLLGAIRDDDPETPWLEDLERELGR